MNSFTSSTQISALREKVKAIEVSALSCPATVREYQKSHIILSSCVHPETDKLLPWPMRVSAFLAVSVPLMAGMTLSAPTMFNSLMWQWINQSYMAGLNYGNKSAS